MCASTIIALNSLDFIEGREPILIDYEAGSSATVEMHDGTTLVLRKLGDDFANNDRAAAITTIERHKAAGEIATGLLYIDESAEDMHHLIGTSETPLNALSEAELCPGSKALAGVNASLR